MLCYFKIVQWRTSVYKLRLTALEFWEFQSNIFEILLTAIGILIFTVKHFSKLHDCI